MARVSLAVLAAALAAVAGLVQLRWGPGERWGVASTLLNEPEMGHPTPRLQETDETARDSLKRVAAWTRRRLETVPHPWGAHTAFERLQCRSGANHEGGRGSVGPALTPAETECLCTARDRIVAPCFPSFERADLAGLRPDSYTDEGQPQSAYNILLISVDTARADAFPFNGVLSTRRPAVLTPPSAPIQLLRHVNHVTHPGLVFRHAFATAPWTLPSHASLLTGFPADATGVYDDDHMIKVPQLGHHLGPRYCKVGYVSNQNLLSDAAAPTVPEAAPDAASAAGGPASTGSSSGTTAFEHVRTFGWNGSVGAWDHYHYMPRPEDAETASAAFLRFHRLRSADDIPSRVIPDCARDASKPFFLFAHTNRVHDYSLDPRTYVARVAEADRVLAELLDLVDFNTTIVVLTSDHGEGFEPELGRLMHTGRVHQDLMHATLVVWHPELGQEPAPPPRNPDVPGRLPAPPPRRQHPYVVQRTDAAAPDGAHLYADRPVTLLSVVPSLLAWTGYTAPRYLLGDALWSPVASSRVDALDAADRTQRNAVIAGADLSYAFALLVNGPHGWLAPFDVVVGATANNWNRRHPIADDVEVRMTVQWPLKLITTRINGTLHFAGYNLEDDPTELANLLEQGLLPTASVWADASVRGEVSPSSLAPSLDSVGDFYGRMASLVAAIRACASMRVAGVADLDQFLVTETLPLVQQAIRECPTVRSLIDAK